MEGDVSPSICYFNTPGFLAIHNFISMSMDSNIAVFQLPSLGKISGLLYLAAFPTDSSQKVEESHTVTSNRSFSGRDVEQELEKLYPMVFRVVSAMTWGSGLDPEDLTQDVFLKAYRNAQKFNSESMLSTWVYKIARNTVIDAQRKKKFRSLFSITRLNDENGAFEAVDTESGEEQADQVEIRLIVRRAIAELEEPFRSIVVFREIEELPYAEIAKITGESEGTLKSRLFYAKKKLREILITKGIHHDIE